MIEQRSLFYAFRYMVTPSYPNSLFEGTHEQQTGKTKEELIKDVFYDLYKENKTPFKIGKKKYIIFSIKSYRNRLFLFNFAKEETSKKSIEGEISIERIDDNRLMHVLIFVHVEFQVILIERKSTAFPDMRVVIKSIEWYFRDRMKQYEHTVKLYPLSRPEKFWETIESADAIYELSLTLNAPNMFGGNKDLRDLIEEIKSETNNDETTLDIKSRDGNLNIDKSFWENPIDYIARIGGKYSVYFKKDGVKEKQTNLDNVEKSSIERHEDGQYTDEELENVEKKMEIIDGRSTDKKDNEK